eukprot:SAG11_NODE_493_length_8965_cov_4.112339_6_plen_188_part_00
MWSPGAGSGHFGTRSKTDAPAPSPRCGGALMTTVWGAIKARHRYHALHDQLTETAKRGKSAAEHRFAGVGVAPRTSLASRSASSTVGSTTAATAKALLAANLSVSHPASIFCSASSILVVGSAQHGSRGGCALNVNVRHHLPIANAADARQTVEPWRGQPVRTCHTLSPRHQFTSNVRRSAPPPCDS